MKHLLILTVGICLLISVPAMADQAADEAAVRAAYKQLLTAFNNHDARAMMSMAADFIEFWNGGSKGRIEHEKWYSDYFAKRERIKCEALGEIGVVFTSPDVAIYKLREEYTGRIDDDGNPTATPRKVIVANVFVKKDGTWLWAARFQRPIEE